MTDTQTLVGRARLTDETIMASSLPERLSNPGQFVTILDEIRSFTDAQLAKALWAVVDWAEEQNLSRLVDGQVWVQDVPEKLRELLVSAGLERP